VCVGYFCCMIPPFPLPCCVNDSIWNCLFDDEHWWWTHDAVEQNPSLPRNMKFDWLLLLVFCACYCSIQKWPMITFPVSIQNSAFWLLKRLFTTLPSVNRVWPSFHAILLMLSQIVTQLVKFIFHSI
jgi:hypothetical protein